MRTYVATQGEWQERKMKKDLICPEPRADEMGTYIVRVSATNGAPSWIAKRASLSAGKKT